MSVVYICGIAYCTVAWSLHYKNEKQLIVKVQKFFKMLPKFKGTTYKEALKRVDLHARVRVDQV